jgi:hypothetical protein
MSVNFPRLTISSRKSLSYPRKKAYSLEAHEKRVQLKQRVAVIGKTVMKNISSMLMNELPEPVQLFRTYVGAHIHSLAGHFLNRKQASSLNLRMSHISLDKNTRWTST